MADVYVPLEDWDLLQTKALFFVPAYVDFRNGLSQKQKDELLKTSKEIAAGLPEEKKGEFLSSPAERSIRTLQPVSYVKARAAIRLMQHFGRPTSSEGDIIFAPFYLPRLGEFVPADQTSRNAFAVKLGVQPEFVTGLINGRRTIYTIARKAYDLLVKPEEIPIELFLSTRRAHKIYQVPGGKSGESELTSAQLIPAPKSGHPWCPGGPYDPDR